MINITELDLNWIKFDYNLATSQLDTCISLTSNLVVDMFDNSVVSIMDGQGQQVANYTPDTTPFTLESFNLDMNIGLMMFTFSETVNADTFYVPSNTLQSTNDTIEDLEVYTLTGGNWSMINSTSISLNLTSLDQNQIKYHYLLATAENDTYIVHTRELVQDMNRNEILSIENMYAQLVVNYTEDTTRPQLVNRVIDMDTGIMNLSYDETVNQASLDLYEFILLDSSPASLEYHNLTGGGSISDNGTLMMFQFSVDKLSRSNSVLMTFVRQTATSPLAMCLYRT